MWRGSNDLAKERASREAKKEAAAAIEKDFEATKDFHATFANIMAFVEAIRAYQHADPSSDIFGMVRELVD